MNRSNLIAGIIIVVILGLGTAWVLTRGEANMGTNAPSQPETTLPQGPPSPDQASEEAQNADSTITYTNDGFSPRSLTVEAGTVITIRNESSRQLDFASDDHPTHQDNSELNVGIIQPGQNRTFTISQQGTWDYHDHLNDQFEGRIIVD